jgi:hydrogenase maturation protease
MNTVLIGIGQPLRGDDGAGPLAVERWSKEFSATASDPKLQLFLLETPGLGLLDYLEDADSAILVDAVSTGRPIGTVQVFDPVPDSSLSAAEKTAHGFGVAESISVARTAGARLPRRLILIGIEGQHYALGGGLSDPVRAALPVAAEKIQKTVSELLSTKDTKKDRKNTKD